MMLLSNNVVDNLFVHWQTPYSLLISW